MVDRIDLHQFCAGEDTTRDYLMHPFRWGNFTYATNGHVLVRVPAIEGDALAQSFHVPQKRLEEVLAMHPSPTFAPLRVKLPEQEIVKCEKCYGIGKYECAHCKRDGECEVCEGKGTIEVEMSVSIGGVHFAARYIRKIAALANADIAINPIPPIGREGKAIPFRFDGGIGCLMARTVEGKLDLGDIWKWKA